MRILSKFKDYYDGLQDPTNKDLTYVRHTVLLESEDPVSRYLLALKPNVTQSWELALPRLLGQDIADRISAEWHKDIVPKYEPPTYFRSNGYPTYHQYSGVMVLFCGKLYKGIRYREMWSGALAMPKKVDRFYWNRESFETEHRIKLQGPKDNYTERNAKVALAQAFSEFTNTNQLLDTHFLTHCPVMTVQKDQEKDAWLGVLNPCLKDLQFARVMPPPAAFQELSMFLGGVLANNDKPDPVDNKYKILSHGFDLKDSFRKGPTKEHR